MDRSATLLLTLFGLTGPALVAQNFAELNINDVRARFHSNGLIGPDLSTGGHAFFVPAEANTSPLFSSGLWLGGLSEDGSLKLAAHLFGNPGESDFFPGPLTTTGDGSITPEVSAAYDQVWTIQQSDVVAHRTFTLCQGDPDCIEAAFPDGYTIPASFLSWPAEGNVEAGYAAYLAPFLDWDGDGTYDPSSGDHPCVLGDQALYAIFNDKLGAHEQSHGFPIGLEVHMMPFAYSGIPALEQTVFVHYQVINRGSQTLENFHIGHFADLEVGCNADDVVGTDVGRNMVYAANGDDNDQDCAGDTGYGTQPPAFGMVVLKGPLLEPDLEDNTTYPVIPSYNGHGYDDGIIDNERHGLSSSSYFLRQSPLAQMSDPENAIQYFNYLRSIWKNNREQSYGGTGYTEESQYTRSLYMFPGDSDPAGVGTDGVPQTSWSNSLDPANEDPRVLATMGPGTLLPGDEMSLLVAYVYARAESGGALASVSALQQRVDSIHTFVGTIPGMLDQNMFDCSMLSLGTSEITASSIDLLLFPVPAGDRITIQSAALRPGDVILVYDCRGALVGRYGATGTRTTVELSGLAPGVYSVRSTGTPGQASARFIKE